MASIALFLLGLLAASLPTAAHAEIVSPAAAQGSLAVGHDGTPYVASLIGRDVSLSRRTSAGWVSTPLGRAPGSGGVLSGLVVDGRGVAWALVQAENGSWLALASANRLRIVVRPRRGSSIGPAGLALDAAARPAFAYAVRRSNAKTFLRLVTDRAGRLRSSAITQAGFPPSELAPGAAPVLVRGRLHVVETYTAAAIDWQPRARGGWIGQYLFASRLGSPAGRVGAAAFGGVLWSAWTELSSDSIGVLLTSSASTQETSTVLEHGIFVSLVLADGQPEIGAYDWLEIGDWRTYAGVIADQSGAVAELDGRLEGYAVAPGGHRQILIASDRGLEWFDAPARPAVRVSLQADASGQLTGSVVGATAGLVQLFRESQNAQRVAVATVPLAADGTFAAHDAAQTSPTLYRAVYVDVATGIPYAALVRAPTG
ncbi:MAG TPA: hypothetical protein VF025_14035 [Gaiellaceae bacterium]